MCALNPSCNPTSAKEGHRHPESSEAFLYPGSIAMLLNRLYPRSWFLMTLLELTCSACTSTAGSWAQQFPNS
jgi:hypothetical protein